MSSRSYSCKYCGTVFNNRSNKYRHESKYCQRNNESLSDRANTNTSTSTSTDTDKPRQKRQPRQPRQRIEVKVKIKPTTSERQDSQQDILDELKNLRARVQKMENEPRYNNWIIIGPDMFSEMIDKYGRTEALNFLTKSALTGDGVDVIKKLYLDGVNPEQYPIACRDYHHFRYLNDKREVIDDKGGQSVRKIFTDRAHRAMVLATNEMMKDEMEQFESDLEQPDNTDIGEMFRKLGDVQCRLAFVHSLDIDRLAGMTNNPNHPFFLDESELTK